LIFVWYAKLAFFLSFSMPTIIGPCFLCAVGEGTQDFITQGQCPRKSLAMHQTNTLTRQRILNISLQIKALKYFQILFGAITRFVIKHAGLTFKL